MTDDEKNALRPVKPGEFVDALSHGLQFLGRKRAWFKAGLHVDLGKAGLTLPGRMMAS